MRIIAGEFRGRRLSVPARPGLRPTPDRVRETLFNWLGQQLNGLTCLDLYAGSGALGFEAASRGAERVVMVEADRGVAAELERTRGLLGAARVEVVRADALSFLDCVSATFDVVFLDPPFRQNALRALLERLPRRLAAGARVYVEAPEPVEPGPCWRELKRARAGQVSFQLLQWGDDHKSDLPGDV